MLTIEAMTERQKQAALDCVLNLLGDYARGEARGGEINWEDVDATFECAQSAFFREYAQLLAEAQAEYRKDHE